MLNWTEMCEKYVDWLYKEVAGLREDIEYGDSGARSHHDERRDDIRMIEDNPVFQEIDPNDILVCCLRHQEVIGNETGTRNRPVFDAFCVHYDRRAVRLAFEILDWFRYLEFHDPYRVWGLTEKGVAEAKAIQERENAPKASTRKQRRLRGLVVAGLNAADAATT